VVRRNVEAEVPKGCGNGKRTLAGFDGAVLITHEPEIDRHIGGGPPKPVLIAQGFRKDGGFLQVCDDALQGSKWIKRRAQVEAEVDSLLACSARLWQMPQGTECQLEGLSGLAVGRSCQGLFPRLSAVVEGLLPDLCLREVVRQLHVMLFQPVLVQVLDGLPHGPVQGLAALYQEAIIGDILDHGVLEDIGRLW
jgi:hypothetical protein